MSFLTAEWNDLAIVNYEIDAKIVENYVPIGTELDLWNNKCYISLIGFMFEEVKILGLKIPLHTNFEEVNLRFYVKRLENGIWKRGVVFIKEIVPKRAISIVANTLYKEHYQTLKMRNSRIENGTSKIFKYEWRKNKKWNSMQMITAKNTIPIDLNSEAEFITEHYFGYTKYNNNKTIEYNVTHPRWEQLEVLDYNIDVNFENIYGSEFCFLQNLKPTSVMLAKGSKITIENKKIIS
ncbi:YqjF family protein [Flavobacterium sp.]|uniref:YqjF family protein n=1 Tax=Flavobacterium sp. TaxID=239 RepID=UPI003BD6A878